MRYRRGFIALSDDRDIPMLVTIRNARSITCDQICALLLNNGQESCRRSVHWRLARLEQNGLVERIDCGRLLPEPVFAITHSGLELLELRGHALVSLPSTVKDIVRRSQVLHSVELAGMRYFETPIGDPRVAWHSPLLGSRGYVSPTEHTFRENVSLMSNRGTDGGS